MKTVAALGVLILVLTSFSIAQEPQHKLVQFQMAIVKKGPAWASTKEPERNQIRQQHLANVLSLLEFGKAVITGPFGDNGDLRGIFVLRVASLKEAQDLCATDPMVKAGRLVVELHPWQIPEGVLP